MSVLKNIPYNKDVLTTIRCLRLLGVHIKSQQVSRNFSLNLVVKGSQGSITAPNSPLLTYNNGTLTRFLIALCCLSHQPVTIALSKPMQQRPLKSLLLALKRLGANIRIEKKPFHKAQCLLHIHGPITSYKTSVDVNDTSQFASAFVLLGGLLTRSKPLRIHLQNKLVSKPYLNMSVFVAKQVGARIVQPTPETLLIHSVSHYQPLNIHLPSDPSLASYFMAVSAISAVPLTIANFMPHNHTSSPLGEYAFYKILQQMGCDISYSSSTKNLTVYRSPQKPMQPLRVDMQHMPDTALTLAICALHALGYSHLTRLRHLQFKESNRLKNLYGALKQNGFCLRASSHSLSIRGNHYHKKTSAVICVDPLFDHRIAMACALLALSHQVVIIQNPDCVKNLFLLTGTL